VNGWNPASQKVLTKAGFQLEGRERCVVFKDGRFTDLVVFGLLRPEDLRSDEYKAAMTLYDQQVEALSSKSS